MANVTVKGTFKDLCSYLPSGDEVSRAIDAAYACLTPAQRLADNLVLYAVAGQSTTKAEVDDDAGATPLLVVIKSNGTLCYLNMWDLDADNVTAGVDAEVQIPVAGTANEITWALFGGASWRRYWDTGLTIAVTSTLEGSVAPSNTPDVYILHTGA